MKKSTDHNVKVKFLPSHKTIRVPAGTAVTKAAVLAGITLDNACGCKGICGNCTVRILSGRLSPETVTEKDHIDDELTAQGWLLACQRTILSDAEFLVENKMTDTTPSDIKSISSTVIKDLVRPDPIIYKKFLELPPPSPDDQKSDLERVLNNLSFRANVGLNIIRALPAVLREKDFTVTATFMGKNLLTIEPGDTTQFFYGIALDIGTTSVAGYLADLKTGKLLESACVSNQQISFGADVISRITYCMENKNGLDRLQKAASDSVNQIISRLVKKARISAEHIYMLTAVGNTTMIHLMLGVTPEKIVRSPFIPAFGGNITVQACELGISVPDYTRFCVLPNIAGYVGSDTVGVILATKADKQNNTWLVVDIGTNGEIVLTSKSKLLTCSTAAGPAFEGGGIKCGMRAVSGAVSSVVINKDVEFSVIGMAEPAGICGSGLVDVVSEMVRVGILKDNGRIKTQEECPKELSPLVIRRIRGDKKNRRFILVEGEQEISISQKDVRNLQLAKGSIRAGIEVLLKESGITGNDLDAILLAGAFGNNLKITSLLGIGMIPTIEQDNIKYVGHSAGIGSYMSLISRQELKRSKEVAEKIEHVELSRSKYFQDLFMQYINFNPDEMEDWML